MEIKVKEIRFYPKGNKKPLKNFKQINDKIGYTF